jgi:GNAT superfamily N-acetyltransferase
MLAAVPVYPPAVIRASRPEDFADAHRVVRASFPAFVNTDAGFRHRQISMPPAARLRSWVAEEDGVLVGWGRSFFRYEESSGSAHASVAVAPSRRRRGVGSALLQHTLRHVEEAPRVFTLTTGDGHAFAERHGFARRQTLFVSAVDPRAVDAAELDATDVELRTLADLGPEEVFAVDAAAAVDVPADEPPDAMDFDQWVRDYWENPDFAWGSSFGAVVDGRTVAVSHLALDLEGHRAANAFTGTLREFRGRGLARLVKLAVLREAAALGVTSVVTDNDARNAAMLAVNARLGYRPYAEHGIYVLDRSGNGLRASAGST